MSTTFLTAEKRVTYAYYPRSDETSTLGPDDKLQVVYNIYRDERSPTRNKGPVNLFFIHSTCLCKEAWEIWIEKFFDLYGDDIGTVISMDTINHGESFLLNQNKLGLTCSWEDIGKDVILILRENGLYNNTILIGHSMGGAVALHAALHERRMIESVVSIEPVAYCDPMSHKVSQGREGYVDFLTKVNKYIQDQFPNEKAFEKYMVRGGIARTLHPRVRETVLKYAKKINDDGSVTAIPDRPGQLTSYASFYFSTRYLYYQMKTVDCEVCHVIGTEATWNPPESAEFIRKTLPYVVKVDIPKGQHMVPFEQPDETFEGIVPFINKHVEQIKSNVSNLVVMNTQEERVSKYWKQYEIMRERYLSGKQIDLDRVHKL